MKLPQKPGEYLFYYEASGDCWHAVNTVRLDAEGVPYITDRLDHRPVYWWNLPKPGDGFKESEVE